MRQTDFERALVWHCAPVLVGLKAAGLLSLTMENEGMLPEMAGKYNVLLAGNGLRFLPLCRCGSRRLLLVYREEPLARALECPAACAILHRAGYPVGEPLPRLLGRLMERMETAEEFPHEIGLFLGYPPEDVEGFLNDPGGRGCRLCGCWKVYHDAEGARRRFRQFRQCRDLLWARLERGDSLIRMMGAGPKTA